MQTLQSLLAPTSVAIIGASNDATRIGGRTLKILLEYGFKGDVYAVNPTRREVQGRIAYPSILDVPGVVECAIITIPAAMVPDAVQQCLDKGVKSAIIFSGGFAEIAGEGLQTQRDLMEKARRGGMRLLGPNCIGLFNAATGTALSFLGTIPHSFEKGRNIGVVTQSGGYGAHILGLARQRHMSVGHWVTTGNECDVEFGEVLQAFAQDDDIDVIVGYIEGVRSRENLVRGLELARAKRKPVILMKTGHTDAGAAAAASHTASLAGVDTAYDAIFRKYGVYRARSTEEVLDVAYAATRMHGFRCGPIGILTNSGGMGVQFADFVSDAGLTLATIPPNAQQAILGFAPNGSGRNPIDITAQWINDPPLIRNCVEAAFAEVDFSAFLFFFGSGGSPIIRNAVTAVTQAHRSTLFIMCFLHNEDDTAFFDALGCLVFEEPARAIRAIAALEFFTKPVDADVLHTASTYPLIQSGDRFDERSAKQLLAQIGVAIPQEGLARNAAEAEALAVEIGRPCVVKIVSPDIAHKTEIGGVALGLQDPAAVHAATAAMLARVSAALPQARIEGVLVSPMLGGGVECIIGIQNDPTFGPMVMVGMGGVGVELLKDVAWSLAPVSHAEARAMIGRLRLAPLLTGYRGTAPLDLDALVEAIVAIAGFAVTNAATIQSMEVNPILVLPQGEGALALDAIMSVS